MPTASKSCWFRAGGGAGRELSAVVTWRSTKGCPCLVRMPRGPGWLPGPRGILTKQGHPFVLRLVTTADNSLPAPPPALNQQDLLAVGIPGPCLYYPLGPFFAP